MTIDRPSSSSVFPRAGDADAGAGETPKYRPIQRFWPYVDVPEEPTDEEVAAIDPELRAELFGAETRPFSITIAFPRSEGESYDKAVAMARRASEYQELGRGDEFRHHARFFARDVAGLRDLWAVVGSQHDVDVLIDDRPVPFARTLWLPLAWFLLFR
jgi:hypothetical protein